MDIRPRAFDNSRMAHGVYFIGCGGFVKIGVTTDLAGRLEQLASANPLPLTVLRFEEMPGAQACHRERLLHRAFAKFRHRGEWFVADPQLVEFIETEPYT